MAHYMPPNHEKAINVFPDSLAIVPQDDDISQMYIADVYWLVLAQLRAGKPAATQETLRSAFTRICMSVIT